MENINITKALKALENANYAGYFEEIDKFGVPSHSTILYNELKSKFIQGLKSFDFSQQLEVFAKSLKPTQHIVNKNKEYSQSLISETINGHILTDYIAEGGFGTVYKAKHKHLGYIRAIKISHEIKEEINTIDRIIISLTTSLGNLNNQYIIKTYDIGKIKINDSMRLFIIMDFIEGTDLTKISRKSLTKKDIWNRIDIFQKICEGLYYSHNLKYYNQFGFQVKGLMHGDIKPSNIMLNKDGNPIILDFMFIDINKLVTDEKLIRSDDYMTGVFGTSGYMAEEQEQSGVVTEQTDIYSLGILLFEILCSGRFKDYKFNSEKQIRLFLKEENIKAPHFISKIISKCTQKKQEDRFENVNEIILLIKKKWYRRIF